MAEPVEPARADAVEPVLVLLYLLERHPEGLTEIRLAHPQQGTPQPNAAADMNVNWKRAVLSYGSAGHRRFVPSWDTLTISHSLRLTRRQPLHHGQHAHRHVGGFLVFRSRQELGAFSRYR